MELTFEYNNELFVGSLSSVAVFRDETLGIFYTNDNKTLLGKIVSLNTVDANAFVLGKEFSVGSVQGSIINISSVSVSCHNIISVNTSTRHRTFMVTDNGANKKFKFDSPASSHNVISVL